MKLFVSYVLNTAGICQFEYGWRVLEWVIEDERDIESLQSYLKQTICGERDRKRIENNGHFPHIYDLTILNWRSLGVG